MTAVPPPRSAWLEIARVSNLPTVWSNVVAGMAWGWHASRQAQTTNPRFLADGVLPLTVVLNQGFVLLLAASLIYTAGMVLNDAADAEIDQRERPLRPIPSGRITRKKATIVGFTMLTLGALGLLAYTRSAWTLPLGVTLVFLVLLYNAKHQRWAGAVVLVPLCRATLAFLAVMTIGGGAWGPTALALLYPAALFTYVLLVALLARNEVQHRRMPKLGLMLAGIALLDAALLAAIGQWPVAVFCAGCFVLAALGQRVVAGS